MFFSFLIGNLLIFELSFLCVALGSFLRVFVFFFFFK